MAECVDIKRSWGYDILCDWYINSVDETEEPKWTPEHIDELTNDFYVIPKQKGISAPIIEIPEWISVNDRLPDAEGRYIVYAQNLTGYEPLENPVFVALFAFGEWIFDGWGDNRVTHWMPLPEPPDGE